MTGVPDAPRSWRSRFGAIVLVPLACGVVWAGGFAWFVANAVHQPPPPPHADGIVVLTGGADRVETGLRLLAAGQGRLLLVTGVGGAGEFAGLAHRAGVDPALSDRATLGRTAIDTHGNAVETAAWARLNDVHSLIVVTAGYHMPRALAELSRTLPEVILHPYPVLSPVLRNGPDVASLRLLAAEYTKYLVVAAGLPIDALRADERVAPDEERRGG